MELKIDLPEAILAKIGDDIKGTSFATVENFVESLVKQKYPELLEAVYTKEEEEVIKARLRKLGYIE